MTRWLLAALLACTGQREPVPQQPMPRPTGAVDAGASDAATDAPARPSLPTSLYSIQSIQEDGDSSKLQIGIGRRDGVTEAWRIRLVRKDDGSIEPDHELVIVRIDERALIARTKFAAATVRDTYDRVHAQPR